jgi:hypothetical protein
LKDHAVVGNGVGKGSVSYVTVSRHPYAYAHSSWKPATFDYQHYTVRGSFFATTSEVLERVGAFEVYWDPFKVEIGFGNWSTKATCGKLESLYGENCFGFISDTFGQSEFITEYFRGEEKIPQITETGLKNDLYAFLKRLSIIYVEIYLNEREISPRRLWLIALKTFLGFFSGRYPL